MKIRNCALIFAAIISSLFMEAFCQAENTGLATLQKGLDEYLNQPRFAQSQWAIKVVSLTTGQTVFERNAEKLMKPASNAKIFTASLALDRLGPDFKIKTSFYAPAKPDASGVVHGSLLVYGRGDPSFSPRFNDGDYNISLQSVAKSLAASGVKRIEGDLIGDDSYFHGPPFGANWTWNDLQAAYGAPVSALSINDNVVDFLIQPGKQTGQQCQISAKSGIPYLTIINRTRTTIEGSHNHIKIYRPVGERTVYFSGELALDAKDMEDSVSVPTPALLFVTHLKEALTSNGIAVTGNARSMNWLDRDGAPLNTSNLVEVASVASRPLGEIVRETLKSSQNQYAELLLLQVGSSAKTEDSSEVRDSEEVSLEEMRKFLVEAGVKRGMAILEDGSGLSRGCLVTPDATVQVLKYMASHRYHDLFWNSLPIAAVDGTLRQRFHGTNASGNLRAKTGSLDYTDNLAGYVTTKGNDKLAFSIMLNNYKVGGRHADGRVDVDAVATMLSDSSGTIP